MKWLQTFEKFQTPKPSTAQDVNAPRIADSDDFKEMVQKYNLQILTTPLQDKRGVVRFNYPKARFGLNYKGEMTKKDTRIYTMYPTGVIRGETIGSYFSPDKRSQYVLFRLYPNNLYNNNKLIHSKKEIKKMIEKMSKTLQFHENIFQRYVKVCKKKLEEDPSFALQCPPEVLAELKHKLSGAAKLGIFEN